MKTIGVKDRRVLAAFLRQQPADGHKLTSNGQRLDGVWMGGRGIAEWGDASITFNDLGSRSAQTVQRALHRMMAGKRR